MSSSTARSRALQRCNTCGSPADKAPMFSKSWSISATVTLIACPQQLTVCTESARFLRSFLLSFGDSLSVTVYLTSSSQSLNRYRKLRRFVPPNFYLSGYLEVVFFRVSLRFPCDTILRRTFADTRPALASASPNVSLSSAVFPGVPTSPASAISSFPSRGMLCSISNSRYRVADLARLSHLRHGLGLCSRWLSRRGRAMRPSRIHCSRLARSRASRNPSTRRSSLRSEPPVQTLANASSSNPSSGVAQRGS